MDLRRIERLVQEDVRDFRNIGNLRALEVLITLLPERVGSLLSVNNLREILGISFDTCKEWLQILEVLYVFFRIHPYSHKVSRSLTKESKIYLFDILSIEDMAKRKENLVALHLLKATQYWTDLGQGIFELQFLRTRDQKEVDFIVLRNKKPIILVECKSSNKIPHQSLLRFTAELKPQISVQLIDDSNYDKFYPHYNIRVIGTENFLAGLL